MNHTSSIGSPGTPSWAETRRGPRRRSSVQGSRNTLDLIGQQLKIFGQPRYAVAAALLLTYIWRFHDLAPPIRPLRLAAIATVLSWVYLLFSPRGSHLKEMLRKPQMWTFVLWVGWMGVGVPFALSPAVAWETWLNGQVKTLTMFLFIATCLVSLRSLRALMAVNVLGAAAITFFYAKSGFPLWGSPAPMYDVNDLALHLNMVLPMVLFFAVTAPARSHRIVLWLVAVTMATSVLMTQSRAGFLTLGVGLLFLLLRLERVKVWLRLVPIVGLAAGFFFLPAATQERLSTLFNPTEDYNYTSEEGRVEIWKRGMGYLQEFPISGVGVSNFSIAEAQFFDGRPRVAHNSFVEVATETGVIGFLLYFGGIMFGIFSLVRLRRRTNKIRQSAEADHLTLAADCMTMSLLAFCVNGFFLSMGYYPILFVALALAASLDLVGTRWLARYTWEREHARYARRQGSIPLAAAGSRSY